MTRAPLPGKEHPLEDTCVRTEKVETGRQSSLCPLPPGHVGDPPSGPGTVALEGPLEKITACGLQIVLRRPRGQGEAE